MEHHLSKDEVRAWRDGFVTREIFRRAQEERKTLSVQLDEGEMMDPDNPAITPQRYARAVGEIAGLNYFLKFEGDEEEEKKEDG
jgi:hypothetical protein